jgi:GT2 family glycosyltransferase
MDDGYFLYFEETDFCLRAARAGWACWYVPASRVVHLVGSSSGVSDGRRPPPRMPAYWFHSRRRYFEKNHGRLRMAAASVAWAVGFAARRARARLRLQRSGDPVPAHMLTDFVRHTFLPAAAGRGRP